MPSLPADAEVSQPAEAGSQPRLLWRRMVLLSLALRLAVVGLTWISGTPHWFFGQASELGVLAESLRSGQGFSGPFGGATGPSAFLAPGYPAMIACVFWIFDPFSRAAAVAITVLQALFAGVTTLMLMRVAERVFGAKTANLAGCFWAVSPALLWVPIIFWETSLSILLLSSLLALALWCGDSPRRTSWVTFGAVAAVALLINSSLLTVVACCFGWAAWRARERGMAGPLLGALLFLALSSFWPMRNLRVMHAWIPLRSNMGYELWQGNRPGADGFFLVDLHPNTSATELHRWEALGEVGYMREKSALANGAIAADPWRFIQLTAKRFACFWAGVNRTNTWIMLAHIATTTILGLWGALQVVRRRRDVAALFLLPLLLFPLPYYITHPDFRFRLVLDPILIVLGAYAVTELRQTSIDAHRHAGSGDAF